MKRYFLAFITVTILLLTFLSARTYSAGEVTLTRVKLDGNKLTVSYTAKADLSLRYPLEALIVNKQGFIQQDSSGEQFLTLGDLSPGTSTKTFDISGLRATAGQQIQVQALARRRSGNQAIGTPSRVTVTVAATAANDPAELNRSVTERARTEGPVAALTEFGEITNLGSYFKQIMRYALPLGVALAIIMSTYAGIVFMMSQGEPDKVKEAQEIIQGAIVGLLVLILSRLLVDFLVVDDPFAVRQAFNLVPHALAQQAGPIKPFDPDLGFRTAHDALPATKYTSFDALLSDIVRLFNLIVGPLIVVGIVVTGIMFITTGGDPEKAKKAKTSLLWIIIGIAIYLLIYVLLSGFSELIKRN